MSIVFKLAKIKCICAMYSSDTLVVSFENTSNCLNTPGVTVLCQTVKCEVGQGLSKTSYDLMIVLIAALVTF